MTLKQFFDFISEHPSLILFYSVAVPLSAILTGLFSRGEGHLAPWKYLYAFLVYFVCIPGIFAVTLDVYLFLFERQSIWESNLYTQFLPVLVMLITLMIIKRFVRLESIPGFGRLTGLILMISAVLVAMWFLDKTHIFVFSYMPFYQVVLLLVVLFVVLRLAWRKWAG
ncbi:MAG TPA: hypothetical protein PKM27_16875 [Saprospiraceae bacterium]|nr:hypothetical protein [Saprospiraceae bacterium]HNT20297.1 hypothetical protein [Saprospiraceae bacterium]